MEGGAETRSLEIWNLESTNPTVNTPFDFFVVENVNFGFRHPPPQILEEVHILIFFGRFPIFYCDMLNMINSSFFKHKTV